MRMRGTKNGTEKMKYAVSIIAMFARDNAGQKDIFDLRLRSMISPASTGPRLRRIAPPMLFSFQSRAHA
jgi:hypothetical protein